MDGLLNDPGAGEADGRAWLGNVDVAQHRERRGDAAGRRVREDDDVGQAGLAHLVDGDDRTRHLHEAEDALLHAGAAGRRDRDQRRLLQLGQLGGGDHRLADGQAHGPAHEVEVERGDDDGLATHRAVGDDDRLLLLGLLLVFAQPVRVALDVAKLQPGSTVTCGSSIRV